MASGTDYDYATMGAAVNKYMDTAGTLKKIAEVLEYAINILDHTAFLGQVGGAAIKAYMEKIKPEILKLAEKLIEISDDVKKFVAQARNMDATDANLFKVDL